VVRVVVVLAFALFAPLLAAEAQQASKQVKIGVLSQGFPDSAPGLPLLQPLRALGWVEGQNFVLDSRFDMGKRDQLPGLAAELVGRNVDVIFARGTPAALAAKAATQTIPIVMIFAADPVRSRLVASLARPGGNITGLSILAARGESW
jgi:putative ABC transport system substrate-binding protein